MEPPNLDTALNAYPGVGPARLRALNRLGLFRGGDLLDYYPRDYEDRTRSYTIRDAPPGEPVCVRAMAAELPWLTRVNQGLELVKLKAVDDTGTMTVTFFNQRYVRAAISPGESYIFFGILERFGSSCQMTNPVFELESSPRFTGRIMPVYSLTAGLSNHFLAGLTERTLNAVLDVVTEPLPEALLDRFHLARRQFALRNIHFPDSLDSLELARRRLVFEEFLYLSVGLSMLRRRRSGEGGLVFSPFAMEEFARLLPFPLTAAQRRVIEEAACDLTSGRIMNRLVQGDVGSGKTAIAAACCWLSAKSGYQSAFMAPTELLAKQHFRTLTALLAPSGLRVALLTASVKGSERKALYSALLAGEIDILVGTHALLSPGVAFRSLGLAVADEQHRFGVAQRAALSAKGSRPHVLVMSATPIPRTLALIMYGDLDISIVDELPPGRTPVATFLIGEDKRTRINRFVEKLTREGRQVYMVCPLIEEQPGDTSPGEAPSLSNLKSVIAYTAQLQATVFPTLRVALLHGKMKPREKEEVMSAFLSGEIDVLVSTTVIEVGVDVPNAALMIIENAERFGLSQLHQLRGRVGRGTHQSYCVLITGTKHPESLRRLNALTKTGDGFSIAEEDLKLRGPGDFFGHRQHGLPHLKVADFAADTRALKEAQNAAEELLSVDPDLTASEHTGILKQVKRLFEENPDIFN
ncbi:MAG: helicase RecG [Oscillospiraceae bacterium]|nr:helicase RecG [Oscillospiraceae bacterium]